jgi:hypothetical protein
MEAKTREEAELREVPAGQVAADRRRKVERAAAAVAPARAAAVAPMRAAAAPWQRVALERLGAADATNR